MYAGLAQMVIGTAHGAAFLSKRAHIGMKGSQSMFAHLRLSLPIPTVCALPLFKIFLQLGEEVCRQVPNCWRALRLKGHLGPKMFVANTL
jgi:hypothetical protein